MVICTGACVVFACADFEVKEDNISLDLSSDILKIEEIMNFAKDLESVQSNLESKRINQKKAETQIQVIMEPLIQNGKHLQSQILNYLK